MSKKSEASCSQRARDYALRCADNQEDVPATVRQAYTKWFVYKEKYGLDESKLDAVGERIEGLWLPILMDSQERKGKQRLLDWQCAMLSWPFGFYKSDGCRVVSELHLRTPENLGKSTLAAALCLDVMINPLKGKGAFEKNTICLEVGKWNTSSVFGKVHSAFKADTRLRDVLRVSHPIKTTQKDIECERRLGKVLRRPFKTVHSQLTAQLLIVDARRHKVPDSLFLSHMSWCLARLRIVLLTPEKNPDSKYKSQQAFAFSWLDNADFDHIVPLLY